MATQAQIDANRKNAELSHGPVTTEGKARSAANSTKHGLSAPLTVLPHEDAEDFQDILDGYIREFDPNGYHETFLVHQMVLARMRLSRVQRLELAYLQQSVNLESGPEEADAAILDAMERRGPGVLATLQRYAAAAERSYHKAHRELTANRHAQASEARNKARDEERDFNQMIEAYINAPMPTLATEPAPSPIQNEPNSTAAPDPRVSTKRTQSAPRAA